MKRDRSLWIVALCASLVLGACSDNDDDDSDDEATGNAFVAELLDDTSETTDPEPVNGLELDFSDDPQAFDELFD